MQDVLFVLNDFPALCRLIWKNRWDTAGSISIVQEGTRLPPQQMVGNPEMNSCSWDSVEPLPLPAPCLLPEEGRQCPGQYRLETAGAAVKWSFI